MNELVRSILCLIEGNGYICYIIGGYVRDYLLNIESNDYDICTNATMDDLINIFKDYDYEVYFDTMKFNIDNLNIEITPFRVELEYNNRKPIKYYNVNDLSVDINRRDFTINTICMNSREEIIDLIGGINELNNKIIKCVGDSYIKLKEDPLRILRALRFSAYLNFDIDEQLKRSIKENSYLLRSLSYEKKKEEINKLISIKRLDILKLYNLEKYLDIDLSNICYYSNNILTWYNIDYLNKYLISKKDINIINKINLLKNNKFSNYSIYLAGLDVCKLASEYFDMDILNRYNSLVIKDRKDIDITSNEILDIVKDKKVIGYIYKLLEIQIVDNNLDNIKDKIINYINNYIRW